MSDGICEQDCDHNPNVGANNTNNTNSDENTTQEEDQQSSMESAVATAVAATDSDPTENSRESDSASELPLVPEVCVESDGERSVNMNNKAGRKLMGKKVETTFGVGVVADFRSTDGVYEIKLESKATLYSTQVPKLCPKTQAEIANQLNVAYEALEKMRRLNLDVQCYEMGIPGNQVDYDMCTSCLMANKGSTKSHFPRLQRFVESADAATKDFDNQVKKQMPGLHSFFNKTLPASTMSASKRMANSISASLQEVHNISSSTVTRPNTVAATPASSSSTRKARSGTPKNQPKGTARAKSVPDSRSARNNVENHPVVANGGKRNNPPANRIGKLWGSIRNLPQPASPQMSSSPPKANDTSDSKMSSTLAVSTSPSSKNTMATPDSSVVSAGIKGILNSSVTQTIFGENKVKEDGSSADPNVIMNNRISGGSLENTLSCKPVPIKSDKPIALPGIQRLINKRTRVNTSPCLICASPSCPSCSSSSFRKEGITLCLKCERLFELDFIVDCVSTSDPTQRAERIEYMVDCYDRCMLLLQYSKQFVEQIASSLEDQKTKQDKIGLASSSVGVVSGILGIAAAASILTPAGPPLLIASLFFGGGATTVQSSTEALNYLSEPRKLADRIIALHGMSLSILRVTSTLRDAMMRDHIRTDVYEVEAAPMANKMKDSFEKNKTNIVMGSNLGRSLTLGARGLVGVEAGAVGTAAGVALGEASAVAAAGTTAAAAGTSAASAAGAASAAAVFPGASTAAGASAAGASAARGATAFSRAGTAAARTMRFARFAGGALSAAVLVMEANAIQSTVRSISQGSPCDKAETLRKVMNEIEDFPSTTDLDEECRAYLSALASRPPPPVEVVAESESPGSDKGDDGIVTCEQVDLVQADQLCAPGAMILDQASGAPGALPNNTDGHPMAAAVPVSPAGSSFLGNSSSLFQRLNTRRVDRRDDRRAAAEEVVAVVVEGDQLGESNLSLVL